jgi:thiol-disulfide isomerase/thioredoxin
MFQQWKTIGAIALLFIVLGTYYWYKQPKFVMGEQAPDFSFQNLTGTTVRLSEMQGKYVLLHFWGSWCGPCRKENKHLKGLYEQYHGAKFKEGYGLEIVSIGMETNPEAWRKAIVKDELIWVNHYTDLQRLDGLIAKQYRVTEIPTTYLLDPKGMIIGVNFQPEMIGSVLSKQVE